MCVYILSMRGDEKCDFYFCLIVRFYMLNVVCIQWLCLGSLLFLFFKSDVGEGGRSSRLNSKLYHFLLFVFV